MANNLDSNITNKVARIFLKEFEASKVLCKTVNTSLLTPEFTPQFGETVRFKRPHQYRSTETVDGDLTAVNKNDITSGSAPATVQNYITVPIDWTNREEALELDQLAEIIRPAAQECVTKLETNLGKFMTANLGLHNGTVGTAISKWGDVASNQSLMQSIGVPMSGEKYAVMNPFAIQALADTQSGLASGDNNLVNTAWMDAQISRNFGGLRGLTSNALPATQLGELAGATGTISATPDGTYLTAKDSMTQSVTLTGLTASTVGAVRAGDTIEITQADRSRLNVMTREIAFDQTGQIKWTYKVVTGGDTDGGGSVTITVAAAAINETDGQYNNISNPIQAGDTFEILGTAALSTQASLFYHKDAIGLGTIRLPKLHTWDTVIESSDGFSIRVTKYSDGDANKQSIRFDLLPTFSVLNPQFGGTFWGA
tara:strand:- start:2900 stop:4180 length:1281 start_codon:yes stop_codon:yes gene_type:complete